MTANPNPSSLRHARTPLARSLFGALVAGCCCVAQALPVVPPLQAVCQPDSPAGATLPHLHVQAVEASPGDLAYYEARSDLSGNSVRIYHTPDLAEAAASKAACLLGMLDLQAATLPPQPGPVTWSPLVITHDPDYLPPRRDGDLRWHTALGKTTWTPADMIFLLEVMPHEETHLIQNRPGAELPRWFSEGHATWTGLNTTERVDPDLAAAQRAKKADESRALGPAHLRAWGGLHVKAAAIERQLTAEDREHKKRDPSFVPPGPFTFRPGDFEKDVANEPGRYGAALAVFTTLEQKHGRGAVQAWANAVIAGNDPKQILALASSMLGEDLAPYLK